MRTKHPKIFCCLLLVIVTAALYSRVASFPFLRNDDQIYVGDPHIQAGLNWTTFKFAFTAMDLGYPTPLTLLSHALDFDLYGPDAGRHHITNVLLHTLNVVILFLLLLRATGAMGRSLLVAALFALHPLNVESVAWVAERKNLLSTLFFLLALGAYGWYALRPGVKRYLTVAVLFALGLASKPMVITLPFVLLLLDFWPLKRIAGWGEPAVPHPPRRKNLKARRQFSPVPATFSRLVLEKLPLLLLCVGSAAWSVIGQSGIIPEPTKIAFLGRVLNAIYSYWVYARQTVLPAGLVKDYSFPLEPLKVIAISKLGLAVSFLAGVSLLVWKRRRTRRYLLTGWLWYLVTLVPVTGILWMGNYSHADRYGYIPMLGIFVMIVWSSAEWADSKTTNFGARTATAVSILAVLSFLTWRQIGYWQSDFELWAHAVKIEPNNPWTQLQLAKAVYNRELAEAAAARDVVAAGHAMDQARVDYYRDLLNRAPVDPSTEIALATNLVATFHPADAIVEYRKIIDSTPDPLLHAIVYGEIAEVSRITADRTGQRDAFTAVRQSYRQALQANPDRVAKLTKQFADYVTVQPAPSRLAVLGIFEQESDRSSEARAALDQVRRLDPNYDLSTLGSPSAK
ncbi:MAG TPA: hypothetical protein VN950_19270 [Terriglobales bacterium]|nr:hypothetical protein [Terriglobales bacterium]